jgi:WD40 repeat protein
MLLAYYEPIQSYALHVYESAVATMPMCALLETVNQNITAGARLLSARESGWNATLRIIESYSFFCISFSPDGSQLASGSQDGTLRLWSARSGDQLASLKSPGTWGWVVSLAFSPDGSQAVCNSDVGTVRLWDIRTHQQIAVPRDRSGDRSCHPDQSPPIVFSPTGAFIVCGSHEGTISVWETATCKEILVLDSTEEMWTVAYSPDGNKIVSGPPNGMVRVWDSQTGARLAELEGHDGSVNSVSMSPDGSQIASASSDQTVMIWDMRTTGELISVLRGHSDCVNSVAFSRNGRQIVSGSKDRTVRVWDVHSTMEIAVLEGHSHVVYSVAFSPEGTHNASCSGSGDNTIRIWDLQSLPRSAELLNDREMTRNIVLSLDGSRVVSTAGKHGRIWDVQTGTQIAALDGHTDPITAVAFSPEPAGSKIATGSLDKTVRVWDTQSGQQLAVFSANDDHVKIVALSPDSNRAVSVSNDGTIRVWDVSRSLALAVIPVGAKEFVVSAIALSPDGFQVISSSWASMTVWDIATGTKLAILGEFGKSRKDGPSAFSFGFSSDGKWLYTTHHPAVSYRRSTVGEVPSSYLCWDLAWDFQDIVTPQHSPSSCKVTPTTAAMTGRASLGLTEGPSRDVILLTWGWGWLSCVSNPETEDPTHLCWLPVERRGNMAVLRGRKAFLGGVGGTLTILDCTDAINRLAGLGIV